MQPTSDEALIGRIATGDRLAMQVLYARHHVAIYRFVIRLVRHEWIAQDLISEVFLDIWRQAAKFESRSSVRSWMLAIARIKALSSLRRKPDESPSLDSPLDAYELDAWRELEIDKERFEVLTKCLNKLPAEEREIIDLIYYQERSIEEVAEIVGVPVKTIRTRALSARKKLTKLVASSGLAIQPDHSEPSSDGVR
jgi:RNA polymerase sigma-70 factor (ECF subfamily)